MFDKEYNIAVIGAGVIGLSTATFMQDALPNAKITIFADKFLTETTSDGAAGLYRPSLNFMGPSPQITEKWLRDSYKYFDEFIKKRTPEEANKAGLVRMKMIFLSTKDKSHVQNAFLEDLLEDYRFISPKEILTLFGSTKYAFGATATSLLIECRKYLPYLTARFEERGGKIIKRKIENFDEFPGGDFDLVFNCTGLGSRQLCDDRKVIPLRGQVFKVRAPWVKRAVYMDTDTYIIPGTDGLVTLGGTRQFESRNLEVDKHDAAGIWERCTSVIPSLKNGKIEREWVGLRPYRTEVRVEKEIKKFSNGKSVKMVHNYGHGGYGVLSSAGTAMHAVSLGLEALRGNPHSKL